MAEPAQAAGRAAALSRLAVYRRRRANLWEDVAAARSAGATQAEIAAASGLTRQWVARILKEIESNDGH